MGTAMRPETAIATTLALMLFVRWWAWHPQFDHMQQRVRWWPFRWVTKEEIVFGRHPRSTARPLTHDMRISDLHITDDGQPYQIVTIKRRIKWGDLMPYLRRLGYDK
jgi:hypothetical protein